MPNYNYTFTAIGDHDDNIDVLNKTMWQIKDKLFNNLSETQKASTNIRRYDFVCDNEAENTLIPIRTDNELIFNIPTDIISFDIRKEFRTSEFYKKKIYNDIMMTNTDIFTNFILFFVDGFIYTNFYVTADEHITKISFDIMTNYNNVPPEVRKCLLDSEVNTLYTNQSKITILVLPAFKISSLKMTKQALVNITTTPSFLNVDNFIPDNGIEMNGNFLCAINTDDNTMFKYKILHITTDSNDNISFINNQFSNLTNLYPYLKIFYLPNYNEKREIEDGDSFFSLALRATPIPVENIFLFKNDNSGFVYFDHTSSITTYYPNIYKITKSHDNDMIILSCYADPNNYNNVLMRNELALYHRFVAGDIVDKYENDLIPSFIKNYDAITTEYEIEDYLDSEKTGYEYKTDKLIDLIEADGNFYTTYLERIIDFNNSYRVTIPDDLNNYKRFNNYQEITNVLDRATFNEECYLFKFIKCQYETIIYIDNMYFSPVYEYFDEEYRYLYIPTRLITPNTIMIREPLPNNFLSEITFMSTDSDDYIEINLDGQKHISASNVFISYYNNTDKYLTLNTDYEIYKKINNEYSIIDDDDFYPYSKYYIKVINNTYLNTQLKFKIANESFVMKNIGSTEFIINRAIKNDISRFLFYKNGQLVPQDQAVKVTFSNNVNGPHKINILLKNNSTDVFTLIYSPTRYSLQYYLRDIDISGIVDLYGVIDKPLDFRWFDIYINGLKLNENTAEFLGPYLLLIKNVNTTKNLEIYEKYFKNQNPIDLDNPLTTGYITNDVTSYIYHNISGISTTMHTILGPLVDTMYDILNDLIIDYQGFINTYMYPDIKVINPDLEQITTEMITQYPGIQDENNNFFINPDFGKEMEMDIFFNHKIDN